MGQMSVELSTASTDCLQVYFNTNVMLGDQVRQHNGTIGSFCTQLVKYCVVELADLEEDLCNWTSLYLSGRLHKPVMFLHECPSMTNALLTNLRSAAATAALLLPPKCKELEFYLTIAGLSYAGSFKAHALTQPLAGDPRMQFAEVPDKVRATASDMIGNFVLSRFLTLLRPTWKVSLAGSFFVADYI